MKADANVPKILKKDGVKRSIFDKANSEITNIPDLIEYYGREGSWSHCLVDTESNSATLICQQPGEGNRRHYHPDWNEWWFIVEGVWEWDIEGVKKEINAVETSKFDKLDNPLKNAPHTYIECDSSEWTHKYTREEAAFPNEFVKNNKYWAPVARVDNVYGDRNLVCSCPSMDEYKDEAA